MPKVAAQKRDKSFCAIWLLDTPFRELPPGNFEYNPHLFGQPNIPIINATTTYSPSLEQARNYIVTRPSRASVSSSEALLSLIKRGAFDLQHEVPKSGIVYSYYMPPATTVCSIKKLVKANSLLLIYTKERGCVERRIKELKDCGVLAFVKRLSE